MYNQELSETTTKGSSNLVCKSLPFEIHLANLNITPFSCNQACEAQRHRRQNRVLCGTLLPLLLLLLEQQ